MRLTTTCTALLGLGGLWLVTGCSDSGEGGLSETTQCPAELANLCGDSCTRDRDCEKGAHCDERVCVAECSTEVPCGPDLRCTRRGECEDSPRDAGEDANELDSGPNEKPPGDEPERDAAADGEAGEAGEADACVDVEVEFEEQVPSVLLVIDKSGSMHTGFGDTTRWLAVEQALVGTDDGIVTQLEERVRFGILMYSSDRGTLNGVACPILEGEELPVALDNRDAIANLYDQAVVADLGDTPTAESLAAATQVLTELDQPGPKFIVLATDGDPDTCDNPDANGQDGPKRASEQAVVDAFAAGIESHVIAVGENTVEATHLQNLANAGAGEPLDDMVHATAHQPTDPKALVDALHSIIVGARSCEVQLDHEVKAAEAEKGHVELDGSPLTIEEDWQLTSPSTLELLGEACERLKQDASGLSIRFPCELVSLI